MKTKMIAVLMFLLLASTAFADEYETGTWSAGLSGGGAFPVTVGGDALKGGDGDHVGTSFDNTYSFGGNVMYRFPAGWTARLEVLHYDMDINLDNIGNVGTLSTTPVMFLLGYQGMPNEDGIPTESGFTGHGEFGGGVAFNSFEKSAGMDYADFIFGGRSNVDVDTGYVLEFGLGGDYFFSRNLSTSLDVRYILSKAETTGWNRNFFLLSANPNDATDINADTAQLTLGVRYWFR